MDDKKKNGRFHDSLNGLVRCCMNCGNGEAAFEKYGELVHEYEEEDVFCLEKQELQTCGKTTMCEKWTPNGRVEPPGAALRGGEGP